MQLRRLWIKSFRNLKDVEFQFATHLEPSQRFPDSPPKPIRSHALIGQNGTGKSNLIEALVTIFRNVDLDEDAALDFNLDYEISGRIVRIHGDTARQKRPYVWVDSEARSQRYLLENRSLLPSHIFAYYSGRNERLEQLFRRHQQRFLRRLESTAEESLPAEFLEKFTGTDADIAAIEEIKEREDRKLKRTDDRLRRLFYCYNGHSPLALLACILSKDKAFKKILNNLGIIDIESALFVLKQPHHLRRLEENDILEGDPRFWFAKGSVVSEFLDHLWEVAWAPIEDEITKEIDFRGRRERQKRLFLFVPNPEKLRQLGAKVGTPEGFFRYAEGAYIDDLLDEVRITVQKRDEHGGKISFTQLSEGELQMLTVLGLMRITARDHCLFLLDEPDTHLNPIWKLRYFDEIENVLKPREGESVLGESQVLIATHDPMMIGGLQREQVHILRREGKRTVVDRPDEHPQGMGVTGLLKSELFGLTSTLDLETERRLLRRNELFVKEHRSAEEEVELTRLSTELGDLGFSTSDFRDPDYALFVRKMAEYRKLRRPMLTAQEKAERDEIAKNILEEILREEAGGDPD